MGPQEQTESAAAATAATPPLQQEQQHKHHHHHIAAAKQQLHQLYSRALRAVLQRTSDADGSQMLREYQHVLALDASITGSMAVATSRAAVGRNRYTNVLPFDHNRVVLGPGAPYLNASTVHVPIPGGAAAPASYIATQGPLPHTVPDFWAMVAALHCPAVVMLTNVREAGVAKCAAYLPTDSRGPGGGGSSSGSKVQGCWDVQVERSLAFSPDCTLRMLRLTDTSSSSSSSSSHRVAHYHFHAWPDHGVPASSSGIRAICRHLGAARGTGRPVVVHCSAGIGRTGTFIALDVLLQCLDAWSTAPQPPSRDQVEQALDVPALVHGLRRQRLGMVQTLEQYAFITAALADELAQRLNE